MFGNLDDEKKKDPQNTNGGGLMGAIRGTNNPQNINKIAGQVPGAAPEGTMKAIKPAQPNAQPAANDVVSAQPVAQEPKGTLNQFVPSEQPMQVAQPAPTSPNTDTSPQTYTGSLLNQLGSNGAAQASYDPSALQSAILSRGGGTRGEANFNANTLNNDATFRDQASQVNQFAYQNTELNKQLEAQKAATAKAEAEAKQAAELKATQDKAAADAKTKADQDAAAAKLAQDNAAKESAAKTAQAKKEADDAAAKAAAQSKAQNAQIVTPAAAQVTPPAVTTPAPVATQATVNNGTTQTLANAIAPTTATATNTQIAAPATTTTAPVTTPVPATPATPARVTADGNFDPTTGQMSEAYQNQFSNDLQAMAADKAYQDKDGNLDMNKIKEKLTKDYPEVMKAGAEQEAKAASEKAAADAKTKAEADQLAAQKAQTAQQLQQAQAQAQQTAQQVEAAKAQSDKSASFADFLSKSFTDTRTGRVFNGDYTTLANFLNDPSMNALYSRAVQGESMAGLNKIAQDKAAESAASLQRAQSLQQSQNDMMNKLQEDQKKQDLAEQAAAMKLRDQQATEAAALNSQKSTANEALYQLDQNRTKAANQLATAQSNAGGLANAAQLTQSSINRVLQSDDPLYGLAQMGVPGAAQALASREGGASLGQLAGLATGKTGTTGGGNIASSLGGVAANALGLPSGLGKLAGGILGSIF